MQSPSTFNVIIIVWLLLIFELGYSTHIVRIMRWKIVLNFRLLCFLYFLSLWKVQSRAMWKKPPVPPPPPSPLHLLLDSLDSYAPKIGFQSGFALCSRAWNDLLTRIENGCHLVPLFAPSVCCRDEKKRVTIAHVPRVSEGLCCNFLFFCSARAFVWRIFMSSSESSAKSHVWYSTTVAQPPSVLSAMRINLKGNITY